MKSIDINKLHRRVTKQPAPPLDIDKAVSSIHGTKKTKKTPTSRLTIDMPVTLREKIEEKRDGASVKTYLINLIKKDLNE